MSRDYQLSDTIYIPFTTRQFSDGVPTTLAGSPVVTGHRDDNLTQFTTGITLSADFDGIAGLNMITIVATAANNYVAGETYTLYLSAGTVGGVSVVGEVVGHFTLQQTATQIWDELLTGATHNITNSAGKRLRELAGQVLRFETAQAGAAQNITLDSGASATDQLYAGSIVAIVDGTGIGQSRIIVDYVGSTKVATVQRAWATNPASDSDFVLLAGSPPLRLDDGLAQAGALGSITLAATASATNNIYNGLEVALAGGTGSGQGRIITAYNGTTKVATIASDWTVAPDATTVYVILPTGQASVRSWLNTPVTISGTSAKPEVDAFSISDDSTAAAKLERGGQSLVVGTVDASPSPISTAFGFTAEEGDTADATDDHYNGKVCVFLDGVLKGQSLAVTDYVGVDNVLTVTNVTADAPSSGDRFILL